MRQSGAIARGLARCACVAMVVAGGTAHSANMAAQGSTLLSANLFGQNVVGGGGDDDASADWNAEVFAGSGTGRLCYYLDLDELDDATGVALHRGGEGAEGEAVIALSLPGPDGDEVCITADAALLGEVLADPEAFYVQITSRRHPAGAVRGQLEE